MKSIFVVNLNDHRIFWNVSYHICISSFFVLNKHITCRKLLSYWNDTYTIHHHRWGGYIVFVRMLNFVRYSSKTHLNLHQCLSAWPFNFVIKLQIIIEIWYIRFLWNCLWWVLYFPHPHTTALCQISFESVQYLTISVQYLCR